MSALKSVVGTDMCSCGKSIYVCRESGWHHEWDPQMDDCCICMNGDPLDPLTAVRTGSGYAHPDCADPPDTELDEEIEPLVWDGDYA